MKYLSTATLSKLFQFSIVGASMLSCWPKYGLNYGPTLVNSKALIFVFFCKIYLADHPCRIAD